MKGTTGAVSFSIQRYTDYVLSAVLWFNFNIVYTFSEDAFDDIEEEQNSVRKDASDSGINEENESTFSYDNEKNDIGNDSDDKNYSQSFVEDVDDDEPSDTEKPKFKMMNFAGLKLSKF